MSSSGRFSQAAATARRIWALAAPYFKSDDKWKARGLLVAIVLLNLGAVYMLVQINEWYRVFYDALEKRDQPVFWAQLIRFGWLALIYVVIAVYRFYLTQVLQLRWREWMTRQYLSRWLAGQAFYRMELARFTPGREAADNPDQRIQEDLNLFTTYSVSLSMGLLNAVVTLLSFVGILWSLSGAFGFSWNGTQYTINGFMVWMAVLYCVVGSVIAHFIGRTQIGLNFRQQRLEADFRHHMIRVREYSESIALDKGEGVERRHLDLRFTTVLGNSLRLIKAQKNLTWFSTLFGQAAVVFPFIVAAPRFFRGAIQLREQMQISSAFDKVQSSLSWFVESYSDLATWRATTDRLTSFEEAVVAARQQDATVLQPSNAATLDAGNLTLALPGGQVLVQGAALQVGPGESVVVSGPSGSGKSTLFRAFAGLWPFASGTLRLPATAMFIPQRTYFPDGSLRNALAYPEPAEGYTDDALRQALDDAQLPRLKERLDDVDAWGQRLSGGEQQRLAIARVLLKKPSWVFADEATSALDEDAEQAVYQRLRAITREAGGALVSIAHRSSVAGFHDRRWRLEPQPDGAPARYAIRDIPA